MANYPHLFSAWRIRNTEIPNRIVFAPTCPTWVASPFEGRFTEQAVAYYEERARHGLGLIIIGGTIVHRDALYTPLLFPGLWEDGQVEGLAAIADAVHRHGCKLAIQLLHVGLRAHPQFKQDPDYDLDASWYMVAPSQIAPGEYPDAPTPKELEEHEIEEILESYAAAAGRAIAAGLDGVEFHMAHGYLPWQFLSPLYNHREDRWGGSYENRLRFSLEAMRRIRTNIGPQPFLGYRMQRGRLASERCRAVRFDRDDRPEAPFVAQRARLRDAGEQPEDGPRYRIVYWARETPDGRIVLVVVLAVGIAHPAPERPSVFDLAEETLNRVRKEGR
jgi:2,4-dienoyl-CoA reductase-like NADH-dependent reductase (Old Yellow Enzyme family)